MTARNNAVSIGIIGGADGPTSILVSVQYTMLEVLHTISWPVTLLGGYCLLGPARRGSRKRLLVPMILCGGSVLVQIVWLFYSVWQIGGSLSVLLPLWIGAFVRSGIWLSGWLLWRTPRVWRRQ